MKNQIIILCLSIVTAFSFTSCNYSTESQMDLKDTALLELNDQNMEPGKAESEYYYGIDSRFAPISKTDLHNATTIFPFNDDDENERIEKVNSTEIIIIKHNRRSHRREYGNSPNLTKAQKALFKSLDYGKHFSMKTLFQEKTTIELGIEEKKYNPHYTVVPETQATYIEGENALINYLKENTKTEIAALDGKKLNAIKVYFTITKNGTIDNVLTEELTTGYPKLDNKLKELISKTSGQWEPAKNAKGENIEQELTFTFGPKSGC